MNLRMARKRSETATELSKEINAKGKSTRAKKCTMKKTSTSTKKSPSKCLAESQSSQDQSLIHCENRGEIVKEVVSSKKMKLQLFPLDAQTCQGLEKDGFHPYLELTLSSRKKISSVIQHIQSKWGSSKIARGDPVLYPYDKSLLASSSLKWLAKSNIATTTGDVYTAIGSPSLFRLRYGWSSETENKTNEPLPSPTTPGTAYEEPQNSICNNRNGLDNPFTMPPLENLPLDGRIQSTGPILLPLDDGLSIGGLLSEVSLKGKFGDHSKNPKNDDISHGGFLSEASLQRVIKSEREESTQEEDNNQPSVSLEGLFSETSSQFFDINREPEESTQKCIGAYFSNSLLKLLNNNQQQQQPLPVFSDSLDAFLQNPSQQQQFRAPPEQPSSHSSILDAENTCHAFSFRKRFTTSQKNVLEQVSEEAEEEKEEQKKDELKPVKPVSGSSMFTQDSNGFSAIKWDESRGPLGLDISLSGKFSNGDSSLSLGAFVKDLEEKMEPLEENTKALKN